MSENIDCNLSIGVSETGKIGQDIIVGIISVEKDDELKILINNLLCSQHLINIQGLSLIDKKNSQSVNEMLVKKYISNLIRNKSIKIALFRLAPKEQFQLLQVITTFEGQKLHEIGKILDSSNYQYLGKALQLRYQYPKLFIDTFIKSIVEYIGLNWVVKESDCGHAMLFKQNILKERKMALHIIVNGGPQFSSYQDLLNENLKNFWSDIKTTEASKFYWNLMVATHGIQNAHFYYPAVSAIDLILSEISNYYDTYLYSGNILQDITANEIINQVDHAGKSLVDVLHEHYLERTGSTFRPPKLWRIGDFSNLGEYELTLPYLMLQKSIKEKKITARDVDSITDIEKFYQYNTPLDRDAFIIGKINDGDKEKIKKLKELSIEGHTILDESLQEEYKILLNDIANFVQKDECIITNEDQKQVLEKIATFEKNDFKSLEKIKIPINIL